MTDLPKAAWPIITIFIWFPVVRFASLAPVRFLESRLGDVKIHAHVFSQYLQNVPASPTLREQIAFEMAF
jgi:hypothetical protein